MLLSYPAVVLTLCIAYIHLHNFRYKHSRKYISALDIDRNTAIATMNNPTQWCSGIIKVILVTAWALSIHPQCFY